MFTYFFDKSTIFFETVTYLLHILFIFLNRFPNGASKIPYMRAHEYPALMLHLALAIGTGKEETLLSLRKKRQVVECLMCVIRLRKNLWVDELKESVLIKLDDFIRMYVYCYLSHMVLTYSNNRTMQRMKTTFGKYSKSQFRFPKFHLSLHYTDHIKEFGGIKILDSGHGERAHKKGVKRYFFRTSKKKSAAEKELIDVFIATESVKRLATTFNINLHDAAALAYDATVVSQPGLYIF